MSVSCAATLDPRCCFLVKAAGDGRNLLHLGGGACSCVVFRCVLAAFAELFALDAFLLHLLSGMYKGYLSRLHSALVDCTHNQWKRKLLVQDPFDVHRHEELVFLWCVFAA